MGNKNGTCECVAEELRCCGIEETTVLQLFHRRYVDEGGNILDDVRRVAQAAHYELLLLKELHTICDAFDADEGLAWFYGMRREFDQMRADMLRARIRSIEEGTFTLRCLDKRCPHYTDDGANCPYKLDLAEELAILPEATNCALRRREAGAGLFTPPRRRRSDRYQVVRLGVLLSDRE